MSKRKRINFLVLYYFICMLGGAYSSLLCAGVVKIHKNKVSPDALNMRPAQYFVLSVGVNDYKDIYWPSLKWTESDAKEIANSVGDDTGFKKKVQLLLGKDATLASARRALHQIEKEAEPQDIVVLYFSTHGSLAPGVRERDNVEKVIVLHDTVVRDPLKTGLSHIELRSFLEEFKSKRKVAILATCHSGLGKSALPPKIQELLTGSKGSGLRIAPSLADVSEGTLVLAAASKGETAREDKAFKGDIYTHFFLDALKIFDRNQDGMISALEAHDYARDKTYQYTGGSQRPTIEAHMIGQVEIPVRGKSDGLASPVLTVYEKSLEGFSLAVKDGAKGILPSAFALNPEGDRNVIKLYAPDNDKTPIATFRVKAYMNEQISFDDVLAGNPYSIGIGLAKKSYQNEKYAKLGGRFSNTQDLTLTGYYHHKTGLVGGLRYFKAKDITYNPKSNVKTNLKNYSYSLFLGYEMRPLILLTALKSLSSLGYGGRFLVGKDIVSLDIRETISDETLSFSANDTFLGAEAYTNIPLKFLGGIPLYSSLILGESWTTLHFSGLKNYNAARWYMNLELTYQFGGVADAL